jgi:phosphoribosylanthranilate isomerase
MKVKICGITRIGDALEAARLGATALGFVFAKSPRSIPLETAKEISHAVPDGVDRIGVFVNESLERMIEIADRCDLTGVQLHGDELPETARELEKHGLKVIKAVRPLKASDLEFLDGFFGIEAILVDAFHPTLRGGSGAKANWDLARLAKRHGNVWLAGGLTVENVGDAIRAVHPDGLDLSSGVEASPGVKDLDKIEAFFEAVREAEHE